MDEVSLGQLAAQSVTSDCNK